MAKIGLAIVSLYSFFLIALVIVNLIFLVNHIDGNKDLIPGFNNTMYEFVFVGLWIVVGVTGAELVFSLLGALGQ